MVYSEKRLAIKVPDHAVNYIDFEGTIGKGGYGAGEVRIWDDGKYETLADPAKQLDRGKLVIAFFGLKLRGEFILAKMHGQEKNWLIIKSDDHFADPDWKLETILPPN